MRIGLLTYGLDRPLTGINRYTLELARVLAARRPGHEIVLLTAGGAVPLIEQAGLQSASLPGCRLLPGLVMLGNVMIPLRARWLGLDVVHDPTGVAPFLLGGGGARTVVTVHDVFAWSLPGTSTLLDTLIYRHWLPRVLPRVDAVITDSEASKADIVRFLRIPAARIRVIYPGVSAACQPGSRSEAPVAWSSQGMPDGYVLFVGSIEKRKNLLGLLHAYARLREMRETRPLLIVGAGRGRSRPILDALAKLDLAQHVVFTGYVSDADLPAVYRGADLFVFPSLYEGFGFPPLEAMACGTPVVCSNAGSLPEVVGDAAIMVDPYDVEGLAEAMQRVLTDSDLREELREGGLERASQFTWQRTARETVAIYQELLNA